VINAPRSVSRVELQAAGLATLGLSLLVVWLGIVFAHNLIPDAVPEAVPEPDILRTAPAKAPAVPA
jgi:hypothetical protein